MSLGAKRRMPSKLLTKSKYISGLQCPKILWTEINEPESIPEVDTVTQYMFDQGHLVGEYAKQLFPDGIDIPQDDFMKSINKTKELFQERKPLYEAGILVGKIYARADILNPVNEDEWEIIEVKSSTSVKDVHIDDVSFQKHCYEKAGLKIRNCKLAYVNTQYVKNGEIDPKEFFILEDISTQVEEASEGIEERVQNLLALYGTIRLFNTCGMLGILTRE
jgi:hypothetical protein